jgi:hypothetical protein
MLEPAHNFPFGDRGDHKKIPAAFRNRDFYYSSGKGLNIFNPYTNLTNLTNFLNLTNI